MYNLFSDTLSWPTSDSIDPIPNPPNEPLMPPAPPEEPFPSEPPTPIQPQQPPIQDPPQEIPPPTIIGLSTDAIPYSVTNTTTRNAIAERFSKY